MQHNLLGAMETTLKLYAKRKNPTRSQDILEQDVLDSMRKIQADAFKHDEVTNPSLNPNSNMTRPYKMMLMRRLCIFASVVRDMPTPNPNVNPNFILYLPLIWQGAAKRR